MTPSKVACQDCEVIVDEHGNESVRVPCVAHKKGEKMDETVRLVVERYEAKQQEVEDLLSQRRRLDGELAAVQNYLSTLRRFLSLEGILETEPEPEPRPRPKHTQTRRPQFADASIMSSIRFILDRTGVEMNARAIATAIYDAGISPQELTQVAKTFAAYLSHGAKAGDWDRTRQGFYKAKGS